jgi:hypothetical protein
MCVNCLLCLILLTLPPGKNPFALKINNNNTAKHAVYFTHQQQENDGRHYVHMLTQQGL